MHFERKRNKGVGCKRKKSKVKDFKRMQKDCPLRQELEAAIAAVSLAAMAMQERTQENNNNDAKPSRDARENPSEGNVTSEEEVIAFLEDEINYQFAFCAQQNQKLHCCSTHMKSPKVLRRRNSVQLPGRNILHLK